MKRNSGWLLALFVLIASAALAVAKDERRPNFVIFLVDDMGWRDLGYSGSPLYETPNIDRLAGRSTVFNQGYAACAVCSPSRASLLTGKATARHGITDWIGAKSGTEWKRNDKVLPSEYAHTLPTTEVTFAKALKAAGYKTFYAGKWHVGGEGSLPEDHGFDINKGGWDVGSPHGGYFAPWDNPKLPSGPDGQSLTKRLAEETCTFIDENRADPFLAVLSFYAVHGPIETTQERWQKYRDKATAAGLVKNRFKIDRTLPVRQVQDHPVYAGLVEAVDEAVGLVITELEKLGIADNTVLVFTSDNGGVSSGDDFSTSNLPLRGGKGRQWEGGTRVPLLIYAPVISQEKRETDTPAVHMDIYPTLLELAGLPLRPEQHVDGVSLAPILRGHSIPERDLFWHYPHYGNQGGEPSAIIRSGDWKVIHYYEDGRDELYNLAKDPGELRDVAAEHPSTLADLRLRLDSWLRETGAIIPEKNPNYNAKAAEKMPARMEKMRQRLEKEHAVVLEPGWEPDPTWWGSRQTID